MIKRLLALAALGVLLSGCYMVPMALIGPAANGFTTASLIQSSLTTSASYGVKKITGKTISEHAFDAINGDLENVMQQTYFPKKENNTNYSKLKIHPSK